MQKSTQEYGAEENHAPEPIRGALRARIMGPRNLPNRARPASIGVPYTDSGTIPNPKFPLRLHATVLSRAVGREK